MKKYLQIIFLLLFCQLVVQQTTNAQTSQIFTSSGTYTVPAGITAVTVKAWGGGAGAAKAGNGGGGGAFVQSKPIAVTPGQIITVTVGAGGLPTAVNGANSAFGNYLTANGAIGNAGGAASTGANIAYSYAGGNGGNSLGFAGLFLSGGGGGAAAGTTGPGAGGGSASFLSGAGSGGIGKGGGGSGGIGKAGGSGPGLAGTVPGGGGGAQSSSGASGQVIVTPYCVPGSINVFGNGVSIASGDTTCTYGDSTNMGQVSPSLASITRRYIIKNTGNFTNTVNNIIATGANASSFIISGPAVPFVLAPGQADTIMVTFFPQTAGVNNAVVNIATNNCAVSNYTFGLRGMGLAYTVVNLSGSGNFTVPPGITSIAVSAWGGGGGSITTYGAISAYGGGGGAFVQSTSLPVTPGVAIPFTVGNSSTFTNQNGGNTTFGNYVTANGGHYANGGSASTGSYVAGSFNGGNGGYSSNPSLLKYYYGGGGAAGGSTGPGANGQNATNAGDANGGVGQGGGGSGGNGPGKPGFAPGGGGGGNGGNGAVGALRVYFICPGNVIGNGHTVAYPPELVPDIITNVAGPTAGNGIKYTWQQSTDGVNWGATQTPDSVSTYRLDKDSLQTTTWYRRRDNACGIYDSSWSNTVQIKVATFSTNPANYTTGVGMRNGQVSGYIYTRNGSSVSDGRKVYLKALTPLKGRSAGYIDSALTSGGQFVIDSVYYGDYTNGDPKTVQFLLYPDTSGKHKYNVDSVVFSLSYANYAKSLAVPSYSQGTPFIDTSVLALTGQVFQICTGCLNNQNVATTVTGTVDSVSITGIGAKNNINHIESLSTITNYQTSLGVYGGYALSIQQPDSYTVTPKFANHKFVPGNNVVNVYGNVSNINFNDTTTHVISGYFTAGCRDSIGSAVLEFDDSLPLGYNGLPRHELRKRVTTGAKGFYSVRLPARPYKVHVVSCVVDAADSAAGLSAAQLTVFMNSLPGTQLYRDITSNDTTLNLTYQRSPQVQLLNLNNNPAILHTTCRTQDTLIWPQNTTDTIKFAAFQGPISKKCPLDTGTVVVLTNLHLQGADQPVYDSIKIINDSASLIITSGSPNSLAPFTKTFKYQIIDKYGNYSPETSLSVVVTGVATDSTAKTFVTVSPQVPLLVLHDPPGSASYATWSSQTSIQQSLSFEVKSASTATVWDEVKIGTEDLLGIGEAVKVAAWASLNDELNVTATNTSTRQFTVSTTNTSTISTGADAAHVGHDADIFYGAALNIEYTVGTEVDWNPATCRFTPKPVMVFAPTGINTSYYYTLAEIRDVMIPNLKLGILTNPDSAAAFQNQISVWQQILANNDANLKKAPILSNQSFSDGISYSNQTTLQQTSSNTYQFDLDIDNTVAAELGLEAAGSGVKGGVKVKTQLTTNKNLNTTKSNQTTIGYTLADNNKGDLFSVNIKQDPVYATPMFETVAGQSNCPYEDNTIPLDSISFYTNTPVLKNVTGNTAEVTFYLGNLSIDPNPRLYTVSVDPSTTGKASIAFLPSNGLPYPVNHWGTDSVTVTITRDTISGIYNYDNMVFTASDACGDVSKSVSVSVDFAAPASGVNLVTPVNNWLANKASRDTIPITFNGYNVNALSNITVQYAPVGTGNWQQLAPPYTKATLGASSTTCYWNIGNLPDGTYNLRLAVEDDISSTKKAIIYSPVVSGIIARTPPALYGIPQPVDGNYTVGTQISYSYTENLNNTNLRASMVHMQDLTSKTAVPVQLSAFGNTLAIVPTSNLAQYAGHYVRVIVDSVSDLFGNVKTRPDTSYFTVGTTSFGTGTDALNVTSNKTSLYEDAKDSIAVRFARNTKAKVPTVIYYTLTGNAAYKQDYTVTYNTAQPPSTNISGGQGAIVLPKDSLAVVIYIHPVRDTVLMPNKINTITLSPGGGYTIGGNYSITDTILNHSLPAPVITASKATTLCAGDSVILRTKDSINGAPVKFLWSTGATTNNIKVKTSGSYSVKVSDARGFTAYSLPTVVTFTCGSPVPSAPKVLNKSTVVLSWATVACAVKYSLQVRLVGTTAWTTYTLTGSLDTVKSLLPNKTYQWQIASICQGNVTSNYTAGANFTTPVSPITGFVSNEPGVKIKAPDGFEASVYPNPASLSVNLEVKGIKGPYNVMLINMQGIVLWQAEKLSDNNLAVPLGKFAPGIYVVVVFDKEHSAKLKLVKQ